VLPIDVDAIGLNFPDTPMLHGQDQTRPDRTGWHFVGERGGQGSGRKEKKPRNLGTGASLASNLPASELGD
jgi:NADPH:quinone reductase-like Zn-dependent oxidoreductase